jgi:hypothetical protein
MSNIKFVTARCHLGNEVRDFELELRSSSPIIRLDISVVTSTI